MILYWTSGKNSSGLIELSSTNKISFNQIILIHSSACSKSCGEGVQTRTITCPEKDNNSNDLCDKNNKPSLERPCNRGPCDSFYSWKTGPWSKARDFSFPKTIQSLVMLFYLHFNWLRAFCKQFRPIES